MKWKTKTIYELGKVITGNTPSSNNPDHFGQKYPFITPSDIPGFHKYISVDRYLSDKGAYALKRILLPKNTVSVVCIGATIGKVCMTTEPSFSNQQINSIVPFDNVSDPDFIYYLTLMLKDTLINFAGGSATPIINKSTFSSIKVIVPELQEQQQIAAILSAYDDLIETNNQRIATLEQLAQQIYKEWFVRMRFPGWENTAFEHGIPEGWKIENFDKFCMLQRGFDLPDQEIKNGIYPVMASTSIKAFHNTYKVEPPVITTGRSGSLGTVLFSHQKAWPLNTALFVKNFYGNSPYLVFYTLKSLKLESFNAGAGVPSLNRNHLRGIKIKVPSKEIQNQFDKIISDIFNQKVVLEESNSILEKTRNLLLPRLISGKLGIKQAEALTS